MTCCAMDKKGILLSVSKSRYDMENFLIKPCATQHNGSAMVCKFGVLYHIIESLAQKYHKSNNALWCLITFWKLWLDTHI